MASMKSVIYSGPVTALYHGDGFVLAGIGSSLHVYVINKEGSWREVTEKEVLPGRNIHGIKYEDNDSDRLVVFGQKCMCLLQHDSQSNTITCLQRLVEFSDWIWDICWLQDRRDHICLALGHNVVLVFDLTNRTLARSVHCEEKCILSDALVLAAGTVFNQVVLWAPLCEEGRHGNRRVTSFHRLAGHQGVIFSIDYNPNLRRLCSASDDRSIRLYGIDFPNDSMQPPSMTDWINMKSTLLHVLYGHQARVWDVTLLTSILISVGEDSTCCVWSYDGHVIQKLRGHKGKSIWSLHVNKSENSMVTGGGDHSVRLWGLQSQPDLLQSSNIDFKMRAADFPRNTMLLDFNRVLTITNDGNLLMYTSDTSQTSCLMSDSAFSSYTVMAVSKFTHLIVIGNIKGVIRVLHVGTEEEGTHTVDQQISDGNVFSVHFVTDNTVVTTGPNGNCDIWRINLDTNSVSVTHLHTFNLPTSRQRWVTTATFVRDGHYLVCGDRTGTVCLYNLLGPDQISPLVQTFPKIHGKGGVTHVCCHGDTVYTCGRDGLYRLYIWTEENDKLICQNSNKVHKGFEWLEKITITSEGDIVMSGFHANLFVIWNINQNQKLVEIDCGGGHRTWDYVAMDTDSRFVYIKTREVKVVTIAVRSNQTVIKPSLHGREVCDIKHLHSDQDLSDNPVEVLTTCSEDTTVNVILVKYVDNVPHMTVLHTLTGHISSVRCLAVCKQSHHTSSKSYLVVSGGGRAQIRVWQIYVKPHGDNITRPGNYGDSITQPGNELSTNVVPNGEMIKTGDENCTNAFESELYSRNKLDASSDQIISMDDICDSKNGARTFERQNSVEIGRKKKCVKVQGIETGYISLGDIKLGKAGRHTKKPWRYPADNSDPETRILDLCVFQGQEVSQSFKQSLYFFAAACSDGLVRLFAFEECSREITLISSSKFHNHCVLKTSHFTVPCREMISKESDKDRSDLVNGVDITNRVVLISASTDGQIAFYDITGLCVNFAAAYGYVQECKGGSHKGRTREDMDVEMSPVFHKQLHQSGINSFNCCHIHENEYMLVTGGDDNALTVSHLSIHQDQEVWVSVTNTASYPNAHAAQVTGVWCLDSHHILSVSIDQRLCLWKLQDTEHKLEILLADCKFVNVSDVSNIDVYYNSHGHQVAISGEGLQIFSISLQDGTSSTVDNISKQTEVIL